MKVLSGSIATAAIRWAILFVSTATSLSLYGQNIPSTAPTILYRTAASVLSLPYSVAAQGGMAQIVGTVTLSNRLGVIVNDGSAGIWVDIRGNYASGDRVIVTGPVGPGRFSPQICLPKMRIIGHGSLPKPKQASFLQLSGGEEDSQYVVAEGIVRAVGRRSDMPDLGQVTLSIAMAEGRIDAILPAREAGFAHSLIDAKVRITATVFCRKNDNMQVIGVILALAGPGDVEVLKPGPQDLFATSLLSIESLMRYRSGTDYFHRVRIGGTVTYHEPGTRLILQDGDQAIEVFSTDRQALTIGDQVEAVGFPAPDASGPVLQDAVIRRTGSGTPPNPVPLAPREARSSHYRFVLVSLNLPLLRIVEEPSRTLLLLAKGNRIITAELPNRVAQLPRTVVPGSSVRVSGINVLTGETGLLYAAGAIHSTLLLRTATDIVVTSPAPWWTATRLTYLAIALGVLLALFLLILMFVQMRHWKMETVTQERERLANDIHDTLAQSFAGIGFQIQVIKKALSSGDPALQHHVDVASDLVRFSHREARRSFSPESSAESDTNILVSLRSTANSLARAGHIEIIVESIGTAGNLSGPVKTQLLRIGQEAISNAVRHADPTRVHVTVAYRGTSVQLEVTDNGRGFVMRGDLLGFGIRGMRKRASDIGGDLTITSHPGAGTKINVTVPTAKNPSSFVFVGKLFKTIIPGRPAKHVPNSE